MFSYELAQILLPMAGVETLCDHSSFNYPLNSTDLGVEPVPVDDEGVEGRVAGEPDLLEGPVLHEHLLQVTLSSVLVQI